LHKGVQVLQQQQTALDNLGGTTVGKAVFKAATAAAAQQAMDTEVGVDVQAYDADLTALGGLAKTDGNIIVGDGTTWVAESGATARTSLGLGSIATQASSSVSITGGSITGITDLAVADGGTGQGSYTDGQLLIGNTTGNTLAKATLTAGTGISVTNGSGAITIASTGGGGFSNMDVFTSTGTWTNPGSVTKVKVTVVGGGGSGRSDMSTGTFVQYAGAGGGAAIEVITIPTSPVSVTVGAGGAANSGNTNGATGGTSSFGAYCSASGGEGGFSTTVPSTTLSYAAMSKRTLGGIGSGGTINLRGGGGDGWRTGSGANNFTCTGGDSLLGYGGKSLYIDSAPQTPSFNPVDNRNGSGYGAGGGAVTSNTTGRPSGAGVAGVVIVEY
jgi:hypothetical protein